ERKLLPGQFACNAVMDCPAMNSFDWTPRWALNAPAATERSDAIVPFEPCAPETSPVTPEACLCPRSSSEPPPPNIEPGLSDVTRPTAGRPGITPFPPSRV